MAGIEDVFKGGGVVAGVAIGLGVTVLAPVLKPVVKPIAKTVLKAALTAYDQGRAALAELGEQAEDIVAETRAEMTNGAAARPQEKEGPGGLFEQGLSEHRKSAKEKEWERESEARREDEARYTERELERRYGARTHAG